MKVKDIFNHIDELKAKIDSFGKLQDEILKKINYKFRLDWNYHSNAMEGNSLTRQETRSIMINNVTIDGKTLKDILEIKGHDQVISEILQIGKGELRLSERRIKDIHKAIMHEDNPAFHGKIGEWKTEDNHVINYKGEKFYFSHHSEVKDEMHELINWLSKVSENTDASDIKRHPVYIAFELHLRFVSIHPFYDGNGRTARILMNLILISFGYPPVILKLKDKNTYNQYLADIQGYGGASDLFMEFMGKQLINSLELMLRAIDGKDIDEAEI